jgi:hypothetical protein
MSDSQAQIPEGLLASAWLGNPPYTSPSHMNERDWLAKLTLLAKRHLIRRGCTEAQGSLREPMYIYDKPKQLRYGRKFYCVAHHGSSLDIQELERSPSHPVPEVVVSQEVAQWLRPPDYDLFRLKIAAKIDISVFLEIVKGIDWDHKTAEDFISGIDLALEVGAHLSARELAMQGAEIHFDSEELQKYARVLAPPKLLSKPHRANVQPKANIEWLQANRNNYKGQWVALQNGVFIASAKTYKALVTHIGDVKDRGILITPIY